MIKLGPFTKSGPDLGVWHPMTHVPSISANGGDDTFLVYVSSFIPSFDELNPPHRAFSSYNPLQFYPDGWCWTVANPDAELLAWHYLPPVEEEVTP